LESTCNQLLERCLRGQEWTEDLLVRAMAVDEGRALLSIVVERLGDLFEPRLCETYAKLFTQVIERACPELKPRLRSKPASHKPPQTTNRIYVLSRVTLGADVAVTSVLLDAAKRRYPEAQIFFVGPRKSYELFEADPRIRHFPAPYARSGSLIDRLQASASLWIEDGIVIDPDSRLSQLGLLAICPEDRYFFFESRSYGGEGDDPLPALAARWAQEVFKIDQAVPYIAALPTNEPPAEITVSLGVGENQDKRLDDHFEHELMKILKQTGASVLIDKGGDEAERHRVEAVLRPGMRTHEGAFAPFEAQIARSRLYIGYDSAGGHVASASGVPLISIARGFASERMQARWKPKGTIIPGDTNALTQIKRSLQTGPWPLAPGP
jgi:ADP-heptose:LPS heptosyltransferase